MFGISSPFADKSDIKQFRLFGNKINLLGADNESVYHGVSSDYIYFNEMLDVPRGVFDQSEMRCRKYWWGDYNPKHTKHWIYDSVIPRKDVSYLKTTFKDNPYLSEPERRKILSYDPSNPENIKQGTADDYMWNVYGLGLRCAPEGLVFQYVDWIDSFPKKIERVFYGIDFGYTESPTAIVKVGVNGRNMYLEKLWYEPTDTPTKLLEVLATLNLKNQTIWADSAEPGLILECRNKGYRMLAVSKFPGSINYGNGLIKNYKIHIVDCPEWQAEQSNYRNRVVNGVRLDDPVDEYNHLWDATRYVALMNLKRAK